MVNVILMIIKMFYKGCQFSFNCSFLLTIHKTILVVVNVILAFPH